MSRYVEELASVPATAGLGELAQLVHSDQPVAVTGEDDEFIGMLSRKKVVELVTPALSETVPAEGAEAAPDLPQPEGSAEVQAGPERRDEAA